MTYGNINTSADSITGINEATLRNATHQRVDEMQMGRHYGTGEDVMPVDTDVAEVKKEA